MSKIIFVLIIIVIIVAIGVGGWVFYKNSLKTAFLKTLSGEVVYTKRDHGVSDVYTISANGENKKLLYHNQDISNSNSMFPRWSEDGSQIYFTAMKEAEWKTFVMDADGANVGLSDQANETISSLSRASDIVGEQGNLYHVHEDGNRGQVYSFWQYDSKSNTGASEASWSPDKKYIIFQSCNMLFGCNIMVADKDGNTATLARGMTPDWK